ncbi:ATP-binding cassette domain-containing protein [Fontibacillus panacisegetis]|uniref:ATP-binding cassette domain-containing protein n=1 Tax=Fontibacillus panacisegetis TaxID=670482 RepID=UPI000B8A5E27|nr:ATP-binding cassette domain-containing protein [Fontibacillus panacisegetis]
MILEIESLSKFYTTHSKKTYVIKDINLTISRSEFIVVMGKSGSGKTTLLQLIGALIEPSEGDIRVYGQSLQEISVEPHATQYRRDKVGFIFQFFNLIASINAEDNVAMPLLLAVAGLCHFSFTIPARECRKRRKS